MSSVSVVKNNVANPSIPDTYVSLSGAKIKDPSNIVEFLIPQWYIVIDEKNEEKIPSLEEMKQVLTPLTDRKVRNLETKINYPDSYLGLAYYNNFDGKKNGRFCGTCCYSKCSSEGRISNYGEDHKADRTIIKGFCYCNTTATKINDEYIPHREACSVRLLSLYQPYKEGHDDIDDFITSSVPIIQILYLKKIMSYDKKFLAILKDFRDQYFTGVLGEQTGRLLQELNGRIKYSRICFDPQKDHCKMDWGHLLRILYLLNVLVERIRIIVEQIDQMAEDVIEEIERRSRPRSKSKKKTSSPKGSKGSKSKKKTNKPLSLSQMGSIKLGSKNTKTSKKSP